MASRLGRTEDPTALSSSAEVNNEESENQLAVNLPASSLTDLNNNNITSKSSVYDASVWTKPPSSVPPKDEYHLHLSGQTSTSKRPFDLSTCDAATSSIDQPSNMSISSSNYFQNGHTTESSTATPTSSSNNNNPCDRAASVAPRAYYLGADLYAGASSYSSDYYHSGGGAAYTPMTSPHPFMASPPTALAYAAVDPESYAECRVVYESAEPPLQLMSPYAGRYYHQDGARAPRSSSVNNGPSSVLWHPVSPLLKHRTDSVWDSAPPPPASLYSMANLSLAEGGQGIGSCTAAVPVELQVTNLDQNIDAREMKKILLTFFREHVMVLHVSMLVQSDGNLAASLRVPSSQDAQYAISQLHRKKVGAKRIIISYVNHNQPSPEIKRTKVISLLQEVPGKKLPLFKFRELYERRYHETIGVSEMYNMRDIVTVSDNSIGRMVALHPEYRHLTQPPTAASHPETGGVARFCSRHSSGPDTTVGWAERDNTASLPNVNMSLKPLAETIPRLITLHNGLLPLASLVDCYTAECGAIEDVGEAGVPLEHLVSCLPVVSIEMSTEGFKFIQWATNKLPQDEIEDLTRFVSPPLVGQLALFSRELVDLLKTFPHTRLPFPRFIPAYHHHFGRQCRVADYGFTKLAELFDALPHVVQVLGEGNKRFITLAHRAQIKRFSSDLLRVLKSQPAKVILLSQFAVAYEKTVGRIWDVTDYGVNDIDDLLLEVNETTVVVTRSNDDVTIAIPKREQTPEEIERTRQFGAEVVELLRHSPQCKMQFNRFIPAYHHHFGRQCRVADYGFTKLIELFEAIPDLLEIFDDDEDGEKQLQLVERERLRVLGDQVLVVVRGAPRHCLSVDALCQVFTHYYGYALRSQPYGHDTITSLLSALNTYIKVTVAGSSTLVYAVDRAAAHAEVSRARAVLWQVQHCVMPLSDFIAAYRRRYGEAQPDMDVLTRDMDGVLLVDGSNGTAQVRLCPLQVFARDLLSLLQEAGGRMLLANFETAYLDKYGCPCRPARFGFASVVALLQALSDIVAVKGRGAKKLLLLLIPAEDGSGAAVNGVDATEASTSVAAHNGDDDVFCVAISVSSDGNENNADFNDNGDGRILPRVHSSASVMKKSHTGSKGIDEDSPNNRVQFTLHRSVDTHVLQVSHDVAENKRTSSSVESPTTPDAVKTPSGPNAVTAVVSTDEVVPATRGLNDACGLTTTEARCSTSQNVSVTSTLSFPTSNGFVPKNTSQFLNKTGKGYTNADSVLLSSKDTLDCAFLDNSSGVSHLLAESTFSNAAFDFSTTAIADGTTQVVCKDTAITQTTSGSCFTSTDSTMSAEPSQVNGTSLQPNYEQIWGKNRKSITAVTQSCYTSNNNKLAVNTGSSFLLNHGRGFLKSNDSPLSESTLSSTYIHGPMGTIHHSSNLKSYSALSTKFASTPQSCADDAEQFIFDRSGAPLIGGSINENTNIGTNDIVRAHSYVKSAAGDSYGYRGKKSHGSDYSNTNRYNTYYSNSYFDYGRSRDLNSNKATADVNFNNYIVDNSYDDGHYQNYSSGNYSHVVPREEAKLIQPVNYSSLHGGLQESSYRTRKPSFSRHLRQLSGYNLQQAPKQNSLFREAPSSRPPVARLSSSSVTPAHSSNQQRLLPPGFASGPVPIPRTERAEATIHTPPYEFQTCLTDGSGSVLVSVPPPPPQPYQSSLVFSGSPVAGGGASVMWGQIWSPNSQYPAVLASPMSPAHYVLPSSLSVSWGSLAGSPPALNLPPPQLMPPVPPHHTNTSTQHTISMHTLDHPTQCGYNQPHSSGVRTGAAFPSPNDVPPPGGPQSMAPFVTATQQFILQPPSRAEPTSQTFTGNSYDNSSFTPLQPLYSYTDSGEAIEVPKQQLFAPDTFLENEVFEGDASSANGFPICSMSSVVSTSEGYGQHLCPSSSFATDIRHLDNPLVVSNSIPIRSLDSNIFSPVLPLRSALVPSDSAYANTAIPSASFSSTSNFYPDARDGVSVIVSPLIEPNLGVEITPPLVTMHNMQSSSSIDEFSTGITTTSSRRLAANFTSRTAVASAGGEGAPGPAVTGFNAGEAEDTH